MDIRTQLLATGRYVSTIGREINGICVLQIKYRARFNFTINSNGVVIYINMARKK